MSNIYIQEPSTNGKVLNKLYCVLTNWDILVMRVRSRFLNIQIDGSPFGCANVVSLSKIIRNVSVDSADK